MTASLVVQEQQWSNLVQIYAEDFELKFICSLSAGGNV